MIAVHLQESVRLYFGYGARVDLLHEMIIVGGFYGDDMKAGRVVDVVVVHGFVIIYAALYLRPWKNK